MGAKAPQYEELVPQDIAASLPPSSPSSGSLSLLLPLSPSPSLMTQASNLQWGQWLRACACNYPTSSLSSFLPSPLDLITLPRLPSDQQAKCPHPPYSLTTTAIILIIPDFDQSMPPAPLVPTIESNQTPIQLPRDLAVISSTPGSLSSKSSRHLKTETLGRTTRERRTTQQ